MQTLVKEKYFAFERYLVINVLKNLKMFGLHFWETTDH